MRHTSDSENKFSMIKDRVIQLLEYKGIPKEEFYKKIGMSSASFRGAARQTPLNSNAIENILSELPDVSSEWLLMGKGAMLKIEESHSISHIAGNNGLNTLQLGNNNRQFIHANASEPNKAMMNEPKKQDLVDPPNVREDPTKMRSEREQALETVIAELKSQLKSQESTIEWLQKQCEEERAHNRSLVNELLGKSKA